MSASTQIDPGMRQLGDELVREAGDLVRAALGTTDVRVKGPFDLVTDVDERVEAHARDRLRAAYPDHQLLGEEAATTEATTGIEKRCWVLDPLDGTVNFAFGLPFYSVSLALLERGEPVLGWVLDPLRDELFFAQRGEAPQLNGQPLPPPPQRTAQPVGISTGLLAQWANAPGGTAAMAETIARYGKLRIMGSQALQLCYVAAGRLGGAVNLEAKLWDDAAGALIVQASGGRYTDVQGKLVFPIDAASELLRGAAVRSLAGTAAIHADLLRLLAPVV